MKKKLLAVLAMSMIVLSVLAGCGKANVPTEFVGTWNVVELESGGMTVSYADYAAIAEAQGVNATLEITINSNGSVPMNMGGEEATAKFAEEDGKYYLQDSVDKYEIVLENGQLKFSEPNTDTLFILEK